MFAQRAGELIAVFGPLRGGSGSVRPQDKSGITNCTHPIVRDSHRFTFMYRADKRLRGRANQRRKPRWQMIPGLVPQCQHLFIAQCTCRQQIGVPGAVTICHQLVEFRAFRCVAVPVPVQMRQLIGAVRGHRIHHHMSARHHVICNGIKKPVEQLGRHIGRANDPVPGPVADIARRQLRHQRNLILAIVRTQTICANEQIEVGVALVREIRHDLAGRLRRLDHGSSEPVALLAKRFKQCVIQRLI